MVDSKFQMVDFRGLEKVKLDPTILNSEDTTAFIDENLQIKI